MAIDDLVIERRGKRSQTNVGATKSLFLKTLWRLEGSFFDDKILNYILIYTNEDLRNCQIDASNITHKQNLITNAWKYWSSKQRLGLFRGTVKSKQHRHTKVVVAFSD